MIDNEVRLTGYIRYLKVYHDEYPRATFSIIAHNSDSRYNKENDKTLISCVLWGKERAEILEKYIEENGEISILGELISNDFKGSLRHSIDVKEFKVHDFKEEYKHEKSEEVKIEDKTTLTEKERERIINKIHEVGKKHE